MIYLESVGSYLDPKEGVIYPAFETNEPDMNCPISLIDDEVSYEWLDTLSEVDYQRIKPFLQK